MLSMNVAVLGAGLHAKVVSSIAVDCGFHVAALVDKGDRLSALGRSCEDLSKLVAEDSVSGFLLGVGENRLRQDLYRDYSTRFPTMDWPSLIHPSATLLGRVEIEPAVLVAPMAFIGVDTELSTGVIVNSKASVDHDCQIDAFASIAPGAVLGGSVRVGKRSALGIGATIRNNVTIHQDIKVGGGAFVAEDLELVGTYLGVPARLQRR